MMISDHNWIVFEGHPYNQVRVYLRPTVLPERSPEHLYGDETARYNNTIWEDEALQIASALASYFPGRFSVVEHKGRIR